MSFEKDNPRVCYVSGLSVLPHHRKQGIATYLMQEVVNYCLTEELETCGIINCINDCCSGRTKTYKGYIWRKAYKSKEEISNEYNNWRKKICA